MIEIGIVKSHQDGGMIEVEFPHLQTSATCNVIVSTTGDNNIFLLPSVGTQVAVSLEDNSYIVLGAIYSDQEQVPADADPKGMYLQIGGVIFTIKENKVILKNNFTSLEAVLQAILKVIENLTVATNMGPSGTPLPPTIQAIQQCKQTLSKLFEQC